MDSQSVEVQPAARSSVFHLKVRDRFYLKFQKHATTSLPRTGMARGLLVALDWAWYSFFHRVKWKFSLWVVLPFGRSLSSSHNKANKKKLDWQRFQFPKFQCQRCFLNERNVIRATFTVFRYQKWMLLNVKVDPLQESNCNLLFQQNAIWNVTQTFPLCDREWRDELIISRRFGSSWISEIIATFFTGTPSLII